MAQGGRAPASVGVTAAGTGTLTQDSRGLEARPASNEATIAATTRMNRMTFFSSGLMEC